MISALCATTARLRSLAGRYRRLLIALSVCSAAGTGYLLYQRLLPLWRELQSALQLIKEMSGGIDEHEEETPYGKHTNTHQVAGM